MDAEQKQRFIDTYCGTCLSSDRKLSDLDVKCVYPDLKLHLKQFKVCWECRCLMKKLVKFGRQAFQAMHILKYHLKKKDQNQPIKLKSTSSLKQQKNIVKIYIENNNQKLKDDDEVILTKATKILTHPDALSRRRLNFFIDIINTSLDVHGYKINVDDEVRILKEATKILSRPDSISQMKFRSFITHVKTMKKMAEKPNISSTEETTHHTVGTHNHANLTPMVAIDPMDTDEAKLTEESNTDSDCEYITDDTPVSLNNKNQVIDTEGATIDGDDDVVMITNDKNEIMFIPAKLIKQVTTTERTSALGLLDKLEKLQGINSQMGNLNNPIDVSCINITPYRRKLTANKLKKKELCRGDEQNHNFPEANITNNTNDNEYVELENENDLINTLPTSTEPKLSETNTAHLGNLKDVKEASRTKSYGEREIVNFVNAAQQHMLGQTDVTLATEPCRGVQSQKLPGDHIYAKQTTKGTNYFTVPDDLNNLTEDSESETDTEEIDVEMVQSENFDHTVNTRDTDAYPVLKIDNFEDVEMLQSQNFDHTINTRDTDACPVLKARSKSKKLKALRRRTPPKFTLRRTNARHTSSFILRRASFLRSAQKRKFTEDNVTNDANDTKFINVQNALINTAENTSHIANINNMGDTNVTQDPDNRNRDELTNTIKVESEANPEYVTVKDEIKNMGDTNVTHDPDNRNRDELTNTIKVESEANPEYVTVKDELNSDSTNIEEIGDFENVGKVEMLQSDALYHCQDEQEPSPDDYINQITNVNATKDKSDTANTNSTEDKIGLKIINVKSLAVPVVKVTAGPAGSTFADNEDLNNILAKKVHVPCTLGCRKGTDRPETYHGAKCRCRGCISTNRVRPRRAGSTAHKFRLQEIKDELDTVYNNTEEIGDFENVGKNEMLKSKKINKGATRAFYPCQGEQKPSPDDYINQITNVNVTKDKSDTANANSTKDGIGLKIVNVKSLAVPVVKVTAGPAGSTFAYNEDLNNILPKKFLPTQNLLHKPNVYECPHCEWETIKLPYLKSHCRSIHTNKPQLSSETDTASENEDERDRRYCKIKRKGIGDRQNIPTDENNKTVRRSNSRKSAKNVRKKKRVKNEIRSKTARSGREVVTPARLRD